MLNPKIYTCIDLLHVYISWEMAFFSKSRFDDINSIILNSLMYLSFWKSTNSFMSKKYIYPLIYGCEDVSWDYYHATEIYGCIPGQSPVNVPVNSPKVWTLSLSVTAFTFTIYVDIHSYIWYLLTLKYVHVINFTYTKLQQIKLTNKMGPPWPSG